MTSVVSICNLALSNIGKQNIRSLTEASTEARACNQFYDHTLRILLQAYPWRFAGKTLALAEIVNDKPGRWGFAYSRPSDCLKVRSVRPAYSEDDAGGDELSFPHDIEGETVYCDLSPAFLRFTRYVEDPTKFTPLFTDALAWHLATRLAMPLTRDPKLRNDAFQLAAKMQASAEMMDANEVRETSDIDSDFVKGR